MTLPVLNRSLSALEAEPAEAEETQRRIAGRERQGRHADLDRAASIRAANQVCSGKNNI